MLTRGRYHEPSRIVKIDGISPTMTAAIDSSPSGCRHPKVRPATSALNEATAAAAAMANPRATGTNRIPASGMANGSASRSCSTANPRNTTIRPAARAAQVNRQARDRASAVRTGR